MARQGIILFLIFFIKIGDFVIAQIQTLLKVSRSYKNTYSVFEGRIKNTLFETKSKAFKKKGIKKSKTLYKAPRVPLKQHFKAFVVSLKWKGKLYATLTGKKVLKKLKRVKQKAIKTRVLIASLANTALSLLIDGALYLFKLITGFFTLLIRTLVITGAKTGKAGTYPFRAYARAKRARARRNIGKYRPTFLYKFKFLFLGITLSFFFLFVPLVVMIFVSDLPNPNNLSVNFIPKTTKIYDKNDTLLYEIYANQNRTLVNLSDIPRDLKNATIAIEDKDFYSHPGFDLRGIIRALVSNLQKNDLQGGSTITQQLIKSAFLTPTPSLNRKIREVVLAFWSERIYTKNQILEMYFNYVPYGGTAWGVGSASEIYFGKNVKDLTLAQSAFLAGLPRAPSIYSPYSDNPRAWKNRQKEVLQAMVRDKYISSKQAKQAEMEVLVFKKPQTPIKAPHFVMYVKELLVKKYGLSEVERGGLRVKTSLDLKLQERLEEVVREHVENNEYLNIHNGAALVTNPHTGDILAMVGSRDYFDTENDGNVNLVTSLRQPGSTIKIVTYTLALESGFTEATLLDDSPLTIPSLDGGPSYTPVNYDGAFHGRIPLRIAFGNSFNIPAVRVAQKVGVEGIVHLGRLMGITTWGDPKRYGLAITLGGGEVKMIDLASVYGTIANEGKRVDINPILEVKDSTNKEVYKKEVSSEQVVSPGVAFIVSDILADNNARLMEFGPNSPLNIPGHRVSVKTGTTDEKRDNWTIGFSGDYLVATWVGNNDNSPMSPSLTSGITGAAPMWNSILTSLLGDTPDQALVIPDDIFVKICNGRNIYLLRGTENTVGCRSFPTVSPSPVIR